MNKTLYLSKFRKEKNVINEIIHEASNTNRVG